MSHKFRHTEIYTQIETFRYTLRLTDTQRHTATQPATQTTTQPHTHMQACTHARMYTHAHTHTQVHTCTNTPCACTPTRTPFLSLCVCQSTMTTVLLLLCRNLPVCMTLQYKTSDIQKKKTLKGAILDF